MKLAHKTLVALAAALLALRCPAHAALAPLPADGSQVDADPANSIDPGQDAGVSDVTGGAVTAGKLEGPWGAFGEEVGDAQESLVRALKKGAGVTEGLPGDPKHDPTQEGERT